MRKLQRLVLALAIFASGCVTNGQVGVGSRVFYTNGVKAIQITHTCTMVVRLYQPGVGFLGEIRGAEPTDVHVSPVMGDRIIRITAQSMLSEKVVAWTFVESFDADSYSPVSEPWLITNHASGSGGRISYCR